MNVTECFPILYTDDVARLVAFYERLDFVVDYRFPPEGDELFYVSMHLRSSRLGIGFPPPHIARQRTLPSARPRAELFFRVADVDAVVEVLSASGAPIRQPPVDQPWGERNAYVEDPDGTPVHLATAIENRLPGDGSPP